jgi:HlyD family secretion protein
MIPLLGPAACDDPADGDVLPGLLDADLSDMAAKVSGRLEVVAAAEGDRVAAGALLFRLAAPEAEAAVAEAEARVAEAEARLAEARDQVQRPVDVAVLEAARDRAATAFDLSTREINRVRPLAAQGVVSRSRLDEARAALARDRAALAEAERRVEAARQPARDSHIQAAEAAVEVARAAARGARQRLADHTVTAPHGGRVDRRWYDPGEVVPAGRPVLSLLPDDALEVRVLVPERRRAALHPGSRLEVSCDGCRAPFAAEVIFIAADAEFTPPMMLSREERHKLVYRVEARPLGDVSDLPAGQPVSVRLPGGAGDDR